MKTTTESLGNQVERSEDMELIELGDVSRATKGGWTGGWDGGGGLSQPE
jgi:hypothetical protein